MRDLLLQLQQELRVLQDQALRMNSRLRIWLGCWQNGHKAEVSAFKRVSLHIILLSWSCSIDTCIDAQLTDVLSSSNVSSLLHSHPELVSTLIPLLPTTLSLPSNPTPDDLVPILTAPQFTDAIASLDNALRSGGLPGGMMRELGLPKSAGSGVKEFLEALQALGNHGQEDDRMEED